MSLPTAPSPTDLTGKVALVTGAARGQGRAHAVRLAQAGADVVAVDLAGPVDGVTYSAATPEDLAETVALVEKLDRRAVPVRADVRDIGALRAGTDDAVAELGRLDIAVANAGVLITGAWDEIAPQDAATVVDVNVTGVWNTVTVAAPHVIAAGGGSIVLVSSAAGMKVQPFMIPYVASKWAVRGMAKGFAVELGRHRVRVNSLHPGGVITPMVTEGMQESLARGLAADERLGAMFTELLPNGPAEPADVAEVVAFLAGDGARHITGQELVADSGISIF